MANTDLAQVAMAIQTYWSPVFMDELRQTNLLFNLCNRQYQGDLLDDGNTVTVNQINAPVGERLVIDGIGGGRTFTPEAMSLSTVAIKADQRLVASYDIAEVVPLQSMIDPFSETAQDARAAMLQAISNQLNTYLYTLVNTALTIGGVADMTAEDVLAVRTIAGQQKWPTNKPWFGLVAPEYYADLLGDVRFASADFVNGDTPTINGALGMPRYNFNIYEDNSQVVSTTSGGLFFHPDWLYLVAQLEPRFKISDKHSSHEFAYVFSCDMIVGAKLGIQGGLKHITVNNFV